MPSPRKIDKAQARRDGYVLVLEVPVYDVAILAASLIRYQSRARRKHFPIIYASVDGMLEAIRDATGDGYRLGSEKERKKRRKLAKKGRLDARFLDTRDA
jgi:hypothetical protein